VQAVVTIVLEPDFEADFLPYSFGFRQKRAAHDGLQVLVNESFADARWVVETDVADRFGAIPSNRIAFTTDAATPMIMCRNIHTSRCWI
jgi:retron-type reverse transcriptase